MRKSICLLLSISVLFLSTASISFAFEGGVPLSDSEMKSFAVLDSQHSLQAHDIEMIDLQPNMVEKNVNTIVAGSDMDDPAVAFVMGVGFCLALLIYVTM